MGDYILALDQGTTSSRAILFKSDGAVVASAQYEFRQIYPEHGWVEHDVADIISSQFRAAAEAVAKSGIDPRDIAAIGITNQRETTVVWEKSTGMPIYNAIVWQCRRTADICERLERDGMGDYVAKHTGLLIDPYFSGTKIKWLMDNVQGAREKAINGELLFGTVDTYLIWCLTKGKSHVTDYTNASRTMLFDIERLQWDDTLTKALDIPLSMLPEPMPSCGYFGKVAENLPFIEKLAGIPITGIAGDQQAALFGQSCFNAGEAKNTYGTGCFLMLNTGERIVRSKNRLLTTIACGLGPECVTYALEGSVFNAGSVIQWMRDGLNMIEHAFEIDRLGESVLDADGVYLVPAFTGLGAPYWDMYARGTMVGITRATTRAHFARAVLESIAYQVTDLVEAMRLDSGYELKSLNVDGGASVSDVLMQFQADMLNATINRPLNVESTALGAAFLSGLGVGLYKDIHSLKQGVSFDRVFTPRMDEDTRMKKYGGWKRAVERSRGWAEE